MKDKLPPLEDLLKPVSAKVQGPKWGSGGRELTPARQRAGEQRAFEAKMKQRQTDADRKRRGTL